VGVWGCGGGWAGVRRVWEDGVSFMCVCVCVGVCVCVYVYVPG